jgi:diaminohydroxyphosphoribosylaminopyrimidine deaminase / 5-amino-6-(5-phosphoribosylamino)uracil reductase
VAESDSLFLDAAVELARGGLYSTTPNPRVGCLLVRDGAVIGRGWHHRAGEPHAEAMALIDVRIRGRERLLEGATCFVSLEPCAHRGRTPPCADALIAARIGRVVIAADDPNPQVAGRGIERLRAAGIRTEVHPRANAIEINRGFFKRFADERPWVRVKVAASLDGRTAMASGESRWITSEAARADVQAWCAQSCAIVTGIGTVLADDPLLTVRGEEFAVDGIVRQPLRVVVDGSLRTPPTAKVLRADGTTLVATTAAAASDKGRVLLAAGAEVFERTAARDDLDDVFAELARRGVNEALVEAGPRLTGAVLQSDGWDEAIVYLAPKLLGRDARPFADLSVARLADAIHGSVEDVARLGDDVRVRILRIRR